MELKTSAWPPRSASSCWPSRRPAMAPRRSGPRRLSAGAARASASCWCRWPWASTWRRAGPPISSARSKAAAAPSRPAIRTGASRPARRRSPTLITSDPHPDVLVVHSPDLNSYAKLFKKAQEKGIYVVLIDNPANFAADAFIGRDWDRLGQLEAEAAVKACGDGSSKKIGLVQGDQVNASSLYQYAGIMKVLDKHPGLQGRGQAGFELGCDDVAQRHHDDAAAEPRHLRHHRLLGWRRHRHLGGDPRCRQGRQDRARHHRRRREGRLRQAAVGRVHRGGHDRTAQAVAAT